MDPDNVGWSNLRKKSVTSKNKQTRNLPAQKAVGEYPKGQVANLGTDYEWKLHCLFAVAAFKYFDNWSLANEYIDAGKFDDLVFKVDNECILLQAKFKQNRQIHDHEFWSSNPKCDTFSIYKYILSYNDIKWKFKKLSTIAIILCTNANIPDSIFYRNKNSENNIVNKIFGDDVVVGSIKNELFADINKVVTYQENITDKDNEERCRWKSLSLNNNDIKDFMSKFLVIKVSKEQMDKRISDLITSMEKKNPALKNLYIINHVHHWRNLVSKHSVYMTKNYMRLIWYREENDRCIQKFLNYEISFSNPYQFSHSINLIKAKHDLDLYLAKIVHSIKLIYTKQDKPDEMFFKEVLFLALQRDYKTIENTVECFETTNIKYLVVSFLEMNEYQSKEMYTKVSRILDTNKEKKVIIVSENFGFQDRNVETDQIHLNLFDENTKKIVCNKTIEFQGEAITLKHLLNNCKVVNLTEGCKSLDMMDKSYLCSLVKSTGEPFDSRGDSYKELVESIKNKLSCDDSDLESPTILEFQGRQIILDDIVTICKLEYLIDELFILKLIKEENFSLGKSSMPSITLEKYYVPRFLSKDFQNLFSEELFLNQLRTINKKVAVLTGPPGVGKTTLLENIILSRKLKDKNSFRLTWIINIELSRAVEYLQNKSLNHCLFGLLCYNEDTRGNFDIQVLKSIKKIIVIDGIDENNSEYIHQVQDLIKDYSILENLNILLVIMTCRNYNFILKKIRNKLNPEIIMVEPFNEQDQEIFFEKYVTFKNATSVQNTKDVFRHLKAEAPGIKKFCSTPFTLRLLIDILLNNEDHLEHISKIFSKSLSVYEFYKLFLEEKKKTFVQQHTGNRCVMNSIIVTDAFGTYLAKTRKFAASMSLPRELQELFNTDISPTLDTSMLSIGIFEEKNGEFKFIHTSFEEYFAAEYIWNCLSHKRISDSILLTLLNKLFLNIQYAGVSGFFEEILNTKILVEDKCFSKISNEFGRILSEQRWVESISLLVFQGHLNIVKFVFHNYDGFSKVINQRGSAGETAFHLSAHHPDFVTYLVKKGAEINCVDEDGFSVFHYMIMMCYDSYKIYFNMLFEKMKYRGNFKTVTFFEEYTKLLRRDLLNGIRYKVEYDVILDLIDYLKDHGMYLSAKDKYEDTPVHWAAQAGLPTLLKTLIEKYELEYTSVNDKGNIPLHYACQMDCLDILEYFEQRELLCVTSSSLLFLNEPPKTIKIINDLDQQNESLLVKNKYLNLSTVNREKESLLHKAATGNALNVLTCLINKYKLNPNIVDKYGYTPLHEAAFNNSLEAFKYLLGTTQLEINPRNFKGNTVLHSAAYGNGIKIIQYLYSQDKYKYLFEQKNNDGDTILHSAARGDAADALQFLILTCKLPCDAPDKYGNTPAHDAAHNNSLNALIILENNKVNLTAKNKTGVSLLHSSASSNAIDVIKHLTTRLNRNTSSETKLNLVDNYGNTPLHLAAANDALESFEHLLIHTKLDVNQCNEYGESVFHMAAHDNCMKVLKFLVDDYKLSPKLVDEFGNTPLHFATYTDSLEAFKYLLQSKKIDVNDCNNTGDTVLHEAAYRNSTKIIEYLHLEPAYAYLFNIKNKMKQTALHEACKGNAIQALTFLVNNYQYLINIADENGNTALHEAAFSDSLESFKYLLQCTKLDIKTCNQKGETVLHRAAACENSIEVLKYLIDEYNMSPTLVDMHGDSPLHVAAFNNSLEAFTFLLKTEKLNINDCNDKSDTVLHKAVRGKALKIIEVIFTSFMQ